MLNNATRMEPTEAFAYPVYILIIASVHTYAKWFIHGINIIIRVTTVTVHKPRNMGLFEEKTKFIIPVGN